MNSSAALDVRLGLDVTNNAMLRDRTLPEAIVAGADRASGRLKEVSDIWGKAILLPVERPPLGD